MQIKVNKRESEKPGPRTFRPVKGEESESHTWFTSSGDPIKGMPASHGITFTVPFGKTPKSLQELDRCVNKKCKWWKDNKMGCIKYWDVKKCKKRKK